LFDRRWRILASIFIAVILVSSSLAPFQNFSTKSNDQGNIIQKAFATSGSDITKIGNYVIFGFNGVRLEKSDTVTSGNVGAQNATAEIHIEQNSKILSAPQSALVGDIVTIEKNVTVNDVFYNQLNNQGTIQGTKNTPLALPVVKSLPAFPNFVAGSTPISVNKGSSLVLQSGNYGDISVDQFATLEFSGGIYNINSLVVQKNAKILFDAGSQVRISTELNADHDVTIGPSATATTLNATGIIFYAGTDVEIAKNAIIKANFYTPNGEVRIGASSTATGSFIGNTVRIEKNSVLNFGSAFALPNITWTPPFFSIQAKPSVPLTLNFTSDGQIQIASVIISNQLSGIITAPSSVSNISNGVLQQLPITITIPPGTTSGWHNGTITLSENSIALSNSFVLNILIPTVTTTTVPVSNGTYEYVQTPSYSPFFNNTSDVAVYFTFTNGTQVPLQTYYDVFPSGSVLPISFVVPPNSQNSIPISFNPLDMLTKILFPTKSSSIPEVSAVVGTTTPQNQCTNYGISYGFEKYTQSKITNDISVANTALSVNPNNPLIIRDDIRWRVVDSGQFASDGKTWLPNYNDHVIDNYFSKLPSGNVFVILSVQDPPHDIAVKGKIQGTDRTFAEFLYKNAANDFIAHTMSHITANNTEHNRVVYWQIDNEPNMHPVLTNKKFSFPIGNIFYSDWRTTADATQFWLGTAKSLDPTRPTVINVYQTDLSALNFTYEPYRNLLASDHVIGQKLINNLGIMSFDIYPDQWSLGLQNVVIGFQNAMTLVKDQFTYSQSTFTFAGRWGIAEMAAGPKLPYLGNFVFVTQNVTPTDVSNMINITRTSQFGGQFPAFISLFQLRALDAGPLAKFYPFDDAYGLVSDTSQLTNDGNNNTPNFLGSIEKSVVQNCPAATVDALDLAVANLGSNNVSILLGNRDGTFGAPTNFAVGNTPIHVASGDFNGDGKLDLAVVNNVSNNVSILLGNGDGTFGAPTNFAVGNTPVYVAVADFNGDGKLDLAVTNELASTVSILLGNGDGTFGAQTTYAVGDEPIGIAVGDFNGDGKLDLAVSNASANSQSVSILLGNGNGTFGQATNFAVGGITPVHIVAGDFNGDGKLDLATANENSGNISILLGTGTGSFGTATTFVVGNTPDRIAVGDFNGDGKLDLAVSNARSNDISILLGTGTGSFGTATNFAAGGTLTASVTVADFNGDGKLDLAVANENSNNVAILLGTGTGSFGTATTFAAGNTPGSIAIGNFHSKTGVLSKSKLVDYYIYNNANGNPVKDYCTNTGSTGCLPENDMVLTPVNSLCQLTGLIDNSCGFFSDGQYGSFSNPLTWFSDGTTSYSINTWINLNGSRGSGAGTLLLSTAQNTHVDGINIYIYHGRGNANDTEWTIHNSGGTYILDVPTPANSLTNLNQWYMLTYTLDNTGSSNNAKIYINGQLAAQGSVTGLNAFETPTWGSCCTSSGSTQPLGGKTDETSFWQRVLAPSEIGQLYNNGHGLSLLPAVPGTVAGTIQVGNSPIGIGVNTQTNKIYVGNQNDNTISIVDANTNSVIKTIAVGARPLGVDVNTQTNMIYVANFNSGTVSVINGVTDTVVNTVTVGTSPVGVGVNPVTNKIYVGNFNSGTVSVIDGTTNNVVNTISTGFGTSGIGVNTATNKIYAVNAQANGGGNPGTVSVIDGSNDSVLSTIVVGQNPQDVVVNPTTNKIYVTNQFSNTISVIDGTTNSIASTILTSGGPGEMGINAVTNKIYYPTNSGTIQVIDGNTNNIVNTISVGFGVPGFVATNTNTNKVYVGDQNSNIVYVINGF